MSETMGHRLKRLREKADLDQAEVSAATGIERTLLSKMENHDKATDWPKMIALADLYEVSLDYLACRSATPAGRPEDVVQSDDERTLLQAWRDLTDEDRAALRVALRNAQIASRAA